MSLFSQNSFIGGLDTELDATKSPRDSYRLLINGRARRNVIEPTLKHLQLDAPAGNYQGLYSAGSILVLFIDGRAYYADVTQATILFQPIINWVDMSAAVNRIYAEIVPASSNFFNRLGTPDVTTRTFNDTIAAFSEALFVFDGTLISRPEAIFPDGTVHTLNDFSQWTKGNPEYVPFGLLPLFTANKLFLVSPDRKRILHSVSGRAQDFMVNITNAGDAGGDADTVSVTVSYNDITSLRALASGQLLASTLYASWGVILDYDQPQFGEPYLNPIPLFPAGALNELSAIPLLSQSADGFIADTAFITQSGIHAFNSVAQAQRESNNFVLGAKIKGLLLNPQSDTCAATYDDYGFFAVNTKYGYGALVYDTVRSQWVSLDLSFGHVKQFANMRINGQERLFFITHENQVFEAFGSSEVNSTRVYLGEWSPAAADQKLLMFMVHSQFLHVKDSGQVKFSVYADGKLHTESVSTVETDGYVEIPPIPIPFVDQTTSKDAGYQFGDKALCWNVGVMVEWNFNGELSEVSMRGEVPQAENVKLDVKALVPAQSFAFVGETGSEELNTGEDFEDGFICVPVIKGHTYVYFANGNGRLVSGNIIIDSKGIFTANGDTVAIEGPGIPTWSLRDITNLSGVLSAIDAVGIGNIIGGGNHSYHFGNSNDVLISAYPIEDRYTFHPIAGPVDIGADNGVWFYNHYRIPRYRTVAFDFVEFFFYNYNPLEPDGIDENSIQANWIRLAMAVSTRQFKIVVVATPPYTTEEDGSPGNVDMRLPWITWGAHAVLSGVGLIMERRTVAGLPYFLAGVGGYRLGVFAANTNDVDKFRENTKFGYLHIKSDPLTCKFTFRDVDNNVLDEYAIHT